MSGLVERPLFDAKAFALRVRHAMADENLSLRKLGAKIRVDQATLHRVAVKQLPPSVETYLRLCRWLDAMDEAKAEAEIAHWDQREQDDIATLIERAGE